MFHFLIFYFAIESHDAKSDIQIQTDFGSFLAPINFKGAVQTLCSLNK